MRLILLLFFLFLCTENFSQHTYWQQQVNSTITVALKDETNSLEGFETIEYINNSPDTLTFIWFHLWPNAYKNDRTAFSEQMLKNRRAEFYFSDPSEKGYINRLDFEVNGTKAVLEHTTFIDVAKLILPRPLLPGGKVNISTPFHVKLPRYISRAGTDSGDYHVAQWFPKPAVYDAKGWHAMPYLDQGEFYSDFGNYDVQVTAPAAYTIAATGILQDDEALQALKENRKPLTTERTRTWHYKQEMVLDFAWFASKNFTVRFDTAKLASGKVVDIFSYFKKGNEAWNKSTDYVKDGLKHYSNLVGDYPYDIVSIVEGPGNISSGGMEYPTITLITTSETGQNLDATIVHEVGHNWFYGALASNERAHPWMDEGMNTYYQQRYEFSKYGSRSTVTGSNNKRKPKLPEDEEEMLLQTMIKLQKDSPIETASEELSSLNYVLTVYKKAALWMHALEQQLGTELFDRCMRDYYSTWKHKHPYPDDFRKSLEQTAQRSLQQHFNLLIETGALDTTRINRKLKPAFIFNLHNVEHYNYVSIAPAFGINYYDKIMLGLLVHNYQLPLNNFNFIAGGLYATGSGKINSFGRASYNVRHRWYDMEAAVSLMNFSKDAFTPADQSTLYPQFRRIVPSAKLTFFNKDPSYSRRLILQWKTFLLKEDQLDFRTVISPVDTLDVVSLRSVNTTINRLAITYSDERVLYPYEVNLTADQGKHFVRAGLTANYFFNYADNTSGLSARFFAGKFFYLGNRTSQSRISLDRYYLNMTGPKGNEDYTYSNYFLGRNEFEGLSSQQIMERDGFFKVRTDLLSNKIGKTDDWLMSLNLESDLPDKINPLRVLPIKVPLKVFADVGTYAEAWKQNPSTGRFLFDAGVQISMFRSLVNVYIPIFYSKVYRDYFKSTITEKRFLKTISFSIDIQKIQARKLLPQIPL